MELESFKSHLLASRVGSQIRARNSFMQAQNKPVFFEDGKHLGKPGHSLALRYELLLKELPEGRGDPAVGGEGSDSPTKRSSSSVSHSRINTCFQILDEVLPNLGVYQRVIRLLRDELYAAVFSREYTSSSKRDSGTPQPLPYFVLAQKLLSKRASDTSKLKSEIASLEEQLYTCEADLEKASNTIESCRHDIKDRDSKIHRLSSELRLCYSENERLQKLEAQHLRGQERLRQDAEFKMLSYRNSIGTLKEERATLRVYKDTYDKLQNVFSSVSTKPPPMEMKKANAQSELQQQIASADQLKKQLLGMQNTLVEEYDVWMNSLTVGEKQSAQILPAAVILNRKNFWQNVTEITTELTLLEDHRKCLLKRESQLKELGHASLHQALVLPAHPDNPLVPQLQLTSKYAMMVHSSSDNGNSYYALKEAQVCDSCGYQTVVCPHKAIRGDLIIQLPVNSTHLKISRPALTISDAKSSDSQPATHERPKKMSDRDPLAPDLTQLWSRFRAKFPQFTSIVPRLLRPDEVLNLIQQFYAELLNQDGRAATGDDQNAKCLLDYLFQFLSKRYRIQDIAPQVAFDFLTALSMLYPQYMEMRVLCHMLCGYLDGSAFRYLLLLANYIELLPCLSIQEVAPFFTIVYPTLQEEDVEQLTMNYVAHSNNKVSKSLLMNYFTRLLLRHKEPLALMLESKLTDVPTSRLDGGMLEVEFAEAMDGLMPRIPDQLCRHLFLQCLAQFQPDNESKRDYLPVKKLSFIGAYLYSLSMEASVRPKLEELADAVTATTQEQTQSIAQGLFMTLDSVRVVAERVKALSMCK